MGESIEYPDVYQEVQGAMHPGRLKLQNSSIIFKNLKTGRLDQFQSSDLEKLQWLLRARGHCLKFILKSGTIHRFDGLKESEFDKLSAFVKSNYELDLVKKDMSIKGWNWGTANFIGNSLEFDINTATAFDIPLNHVSQSRVAKNEVTLEFHQNDDAAVSLCEIRFHIPSGAPDSTDDPVAEFHKNVLGKADIIQATGDAVAIFSEVQSLTPRGRYDIKMYPTFVQLHGKTYDYKIPHNSVLRLFLLPHKDGRQIFFLMSLDPPIKQGQTRYHFVILLFNKDEEITLELDLPEEELKEKYDGKLTPEMSGPTYEVISRVMKACLKRKITVPGSFISNSGTHAISCSYKAATGYLYPLERGFVFVHKPPMHIRFEEISQVNFARSAGSTRSFDFDIETKTGSTHAFVSIEKDEYSKLYDFVSNKKLRVKNIGGKFASSKTGSGGVHTYNEDLVDSDDEQDAYMARMKAEGKEREEFDENSSMDSSDESFNPGESGSEVPEEYDSNITSDSDSDSDASSIDSEKAREKREKKAAERARKEQAREKREKRREKKEKGDSTPKKAKGKKKKKDPNAPKKPLTPYFRWLNENRERIKEENPGSSITEQSKKSGEEWRALGESEKSKFEAEYQKEKETYKIEYEKYMAEKVSEPEDESGEESKSKKKKEKKPKSSASAKDTAATTTAGSGKNFKSKEFISSEESSSEELSSDDQPLTKKFKKEQQKTKKSKRQRKAKGSGASSESEVGELPSEEEILGSPSAGSGSPSESGSD